MLLLCYGKVENWADAGFNEINIVESSDFLYALIGRSGLFFKAAFWTHHKDAVFVNRDRDDECGLMKIFREHAVAKFQKESFAPGSSDA